MQEHRRLWRRTFIAMPFVIALSVIGVVAVGSAQSATRASAIHASTTVSLRSTKLGMVMVSSNGRTLYLFAKDKNDKSACSGSCATYWPPLISAGMPTGGKGVTTSLLGTTKRSNGSLQVTYNRHPLYTFKLDKAAGQTTGEGSVAFGAKWYAVSAKGAAVLKASSAPAPAPVVNPPGTTPAPPPYP
jgi:predicted lipoprotein with Yx(FWY)xxD motif